MSEKQKRPITIRVKVGLSVGAAVLSLLGIGAVSQDDDDDFDDDRRTSFYDDDDDD